MIKKAACLLAIAMLGIVSVPSWAEQVPDALLRQMGKTTRASGNVWLRSALRNSKKFWKPEGFH